MITTRNNKSLGNSTMDMISFKVGYNQHRTHIERYNIYTKGKV